MQVTTQATQPGRGLQYRWIMALVLIIGVFMSILDTTIVNIAIPRLQSAFGTDLHSVQWVLTAYLLTLGVATPATSFFADMLGIKRFYIIALSAFTLGSALCGLAWSLPVLILFRILQGLGGAALFPLTLSMFFREFPPEQRGTAMGVFGVPALLGPALGPTLGGYIVTYADWQWVFFINVPIGIFGIILASLLLREYRSEGHTRFDFPGFVFGAFGLGALLYGLSDATTDGWTSTKILAFLISGVLSLAIFVVVEITTANRGGNPLLDLRVFANGLFTKATIASIFVNFALFGGLFLLPVYLQSLRGLSAFQTGLLLLPQALGSMVSVLIGGRLVDRIGVRAVVIPGLAILAFALWQLSFTTLDSPYWWIQTMLILRGVSLGLVGQPLFVAMMAEIRPRLLTQASSISTVVRSVASSFGVAVLATIVQTQTQIHYSHLAEQVTVSSPLGQLLPRLEALFVARGASMDAARSAAIQLIALEVRRQGYMLAFQDAFLLSLALVGLAIIATLFVRIRRKPKEISDLSAPTETPSAKEAEPVLVV